MPGSLRGCLLTHASDDSRAAGAGRQDSQHWWLHALRNPATRGGELPFLPFIGQFHSVLSKDMEELCHLGLIAFFPPGVIIIWYVLRSHTLLYLNLLNITAATYWEPALLQALGFICTVSFWAPQSNSFEVVTLSATLQMRKQKPGLMKSLVQGPGTVGSPPLVWWPQSLCSPSLCDNVWALCGQFPAAASPVSFQGGLEGDSLHHC